MLLPIGKYLSHTPSHAPFPVLPISFLLNRSWLLVVKSSLLLGSVLVLELGELLRAYIPSGQSNLNADWSSRRRFAKAGYHVALLARNADSLKKLADELNGNGGSVRPDHSCPLYCALLTTPFITRSLLHSHSLNTPMRSFAASLLL